MKIDITIGEVEKHQMDFSFDQISGDLLVLMDGTRILQDSPKLAAQPLKSYDLSVGEREKHTVAFQLMYGDGSDDTGMRAIAKPRLMVTAIT